MLVFHAEPKISAYDIHEWIYPTLQLPDDDVVMVQIDGQSRSVYIKFVSNDKMDSHLQRILLYHEYKHPTGELQQVEVRQTGLGYISVRVTGLPPEVNDSAVVAALT
jgi:hypothetical protein